LLQQTLKHRLNTFVIVCYSRGRDYLC